MESIAFYIVQYILIIVAIFTNLLGIYCLYAQKQRKDNQRIFLYALSSCETLLEVTWIVIWAFEIKPPMKMMNLALSASMGFRFTFYLIMLSITLDRLICVLLHIKYNYYITNKVVRRVMYGCYFAGLTLIITIYLGNPFVLFVGVSYALVVCDGLVFLTFLFSYAWIGLKLKRHRNDLSQNQNKRSLRKQHGIPALIIISYIPLYLIPDLLFQFKFSGIEKWIITILWSIAFILDPIIYTFLDQRTRHVALNLFKCCSSKINTTGVYCNANLDSKV
ncbi:uncharacterized protein LOC130650306 [Hydractinia symbiolongicarpus]|uniref:uncharacterized protein LOC130650306 n=1 Tax=Hydractinia symbiolongicarpus TaxID=13093 RepID=UPI00254A6F61|nr:uncharacterized protein LOC130650306 [Hydractinia symbiolongicarpus]